MYNNIKGLSGLVNIGNSCYINSVIQSLSNTNDLSDFFFSKEYETFLDKDSKEFKFTYEWNRLLNGLWEDNCVISPVSFIKSLIKLSQEKNVELNLISNYQNDFQEFLVFFLDSMHQSLVYKIEVEITGTIENELDKMAFEAAKSWKNFFKNDYSKIVELFYGQFVTQIKNKRKTISRSFQPFCFLMLPIPDVCLDINIYDCLDIYFNEEHLQEYKDNKKIYNDVQKTTKIWEFPNILIICLNRYTNNNEKISKNIDFDYEINLKKYGVVKKNNIYELYSICNHYGSTNFGHYTSICKKNSKWFEFNDTKVISIDENKIFSQNAYCLFYKKI